MMLLDLPGFREEMTLVDTYVNQTLLSGQDAGNAAEILQAVAAVRGKRLRPGLLLLAGRLGPDYLKNRKRLCKLGALVELIHTASLIHDDVVDNSPLRRGVPTIQARFGKKMAVYAGDLILSRVMSAILQDNLNKSGLLFIQTIEEMCQGEIAQYNSRYRTDTTIGDYWKHIYGKTVSLFVSAFRAGCIESGCSEMIAKKMGAIGNHLGGMFQIRDDLLDFISDEHKEGKPVHVDFKEGIFTLPVLHALQNQAYTSAVQELIGRASAGILTELDMQELDKIVYLSGGLRAAVCMMESHQESAALLLAALPVNMVTETISKIMQELSVSEMLM